MRHQVNRGHEIKEGKLLDVIRERPPLYLGTRSISALSAYLQGFGFAQRVHGIDAPSQLPIDFHDWVAYRLHYYESTKGWARMILEQSPDESGALDKFFELLDEHRVRQARVVATIQSHPREYQSMQTNRGFTVTAFGKQDPNKSLSSEQGEWVEKLMPENLTLIAYTDDPGVFLTGEGDFPGKDRLFHIQLSGLTKETIRVVDQESFNRSFAQDERQGFSNFSGEKKLFS
jgi:hypothetical protein